MKIYEAAKLLRENKISPVELTEKVIDTIREKEADIGAYITVCSDALTEAKRAEGNKTNSPLWGIPIAIKDNICTKDILTTAGSRILSNYVPPYDATVVEKLKKDGAIIIGKANMDEFGMGAECRYSAFKPTSNPVNYDYIPGGSSGGSAAAVKSGMALGALGSDTGGSIRQPAAFCGIYGLKPTYSLVSRSGLIAFASSFDAIGPMCTSVRDIAIMLDSIAGYDKKDATSADREEEYYYESLTASVKNKRIGLPREFFENADSEIKNIVMAAAKNYEDMGAVIEECSMPSLKYTVSAYYIISSAEASSNLARYDGVSFGHRIEDYHNIEEMYTKTRSEGFGEEVKRRVLLGTFVLSKGYYDLYYMRAKNAQKLIEADFEKLFEKYDILLTPVSPVGVWKKGGKEKISNSYKKDICTAAVNLGKLPAISVPCGKDKNNMPVGLQLIGKKFSEQALLNAALAYEEGGFANGV